MIKLLDLFSGLGGFSLGLERTGGFHTVAFCEIEPFCQRILAKHWPEVKQYHDIRELTAERLAADGIEVDAICGGFPCTQISNAAATHGMQLGLDGDDSGLWFEYARLIRDLRPGFAIIENVTALLARGLGGVLASLAALGYDAEWHAVPASFVGAPQHRDRVWIIAYPSGQRTTRLLSSASFGAPGQGWPGGEADLQSVIDAPFEYRDSCPNALFRRVDDRPANWVDRVGACGNAVIPQIPELIGNAILASLNR